MDKGNRNTSKLNRCYFGDCRETMRDLIAQGHRVQMCVTSPPYWGLRDYGHTGQLGLESTPDEYVANMVEVFRLVRELLADDGVLWLNLGDSYSSGGMSNPSEKSTLNGGKDRGAANYAISRAIPYGLKPKNLVGITVARRLRPPGRWLVSAAGHSLAQAQPDAGVRHRPLHQGARIPVPAGEAGAVFTSTRGRLRRNT